MPLHRRTDDHRRLGNCVVTATAEASDDYEAGVATFTVTVQSAGNLVLNLDAIADDNTVNIAEKAAGVRDLGQYRKRGRRGCLGADRYRDPAD